MRLPDGMDDISRRRFLALLTASASLALGTSCSKLERGSIVPYTKRPGDVIPGVASYYASTFQEGLATHGVLVKTREGRPIHVEGNNEHTLSRGKTSLRAMGDLLGLYDPDRLRSPLFKGQPATWEEAGKALAKALSDARLMERRVLLLTSALISPTQKALLYDLKLALPGLYHVAWEPAAPISAIAASQKIYGNAVLPIPRLSRADVVLSLQSDFLGVDENAPVFAQDFAARRMVASAASSMNRLWVLEGNMTLTGANADHRFPARPSQMAHIAFALVQKLNSEYSIPLPAGVTSGALRSFDLGRIARDAGLPPDALKRLAGDLARSRGAALVLPGPALPPEAHIACGLLNSMLDSYGNTLDLTAAPPDPELAGMPELYAALQEAAKGKFAVGIFWDANPAYAFPERPVWKSAIEKIPETFRIGLHEDETALDCAWRLPEHHWLESWGDFEPSADFVSLRQPVIGAIHDTMQAEDILLGCLRRMKIQTRRSYFEYVKSRWRSDVFPAGSPVSFESFWNAAVHNGGTRRELRLLAPIALNPEAINQALATELGRAAGPATSMELVLSPASGVYDGRYANNGWLNELPDPVTKTTWGNPVLLSSADAERLGLRKGDLASISNGSVTVEAPVMIQPGQAPGVAALSLGYGRMTGSVGVKVGVNAYPLIPVHSSPGFLLPGVSIKSRAGAGRGRIAKTQEQDHMSGRELARSWTLSEYSRHSIEAGKHEANQLHHHASLIPEVKFNQQKWGMVIDLSACTGCSACVIACQSENNIPVVGPEQIMVGRHMQWIRIDRYYEGDPGTPSVRHQPMLCQQCDNAPCEIVCPVNATTHSPDGLNQMTYNRCVGTRYCSNNCPFKVRRFNFIDYTSMKKEPETLVFNPEVTVRPRGVMEKCTFCIQRIQDAKQIAKAESRTIADGDIQTACAAACPAGAIVFGDLNDPASRVSRLARTNRQYRLLEELGINPSVTYLADISNPATTKEKA